MTMYCRLQSSEEAFLRYRIYVSILYMGQLVSPLIDNAIDLGNMPVCHLLHSVCQCLLLIARDFAVSLQSANLPVAQILTLCIKSVHKQVVMVQQPAGLSRRSLHILPGAQAAHEAANLFHTDL